MADSGMAWICFDHAHRFAGAHVFAFACNGAASW
jgi:hypothetical protein